MHETMVPSLSSEITIDEPQRARRILLSLLIRNGGCVGTRVLSRSLGEQGFENVPELVKNLKFECNCDADGISDDNTIFHHGRSFYTREAYERIQRATAQAAEKASSTQDLLNDVSVEHDQTRRKNRQEEARVVTYVRDKLIDLYAADFGPDYAEVAFDVHNQRPGSQYENVDVIAVHWRSESVVELVSIEVKLDFTAKLIQQASNYQRFSDRVWIAVPVRCAELSDAASVLRESDPLLFEHCIKLGLGILACRRGQGSAYRVMPIHWPSKNIVDRIEKDGFIERHREVFEEAQALAPQPSIAYPRL